MTMDRERLEKLRALGFDEDVEDELDRDLIRHAKGEWVRGYMIHSPEIMMMDFWHVMQIVLRVPVSEHVWDRWTFYVHISAGFSRYWDMWEHGRSFVMLCESEDYLHVARERQDPIGERIEFLMRSREAGLMDLADVE